MREGGRAPSHHRGGCHAARTKERPAVGPEDEAWFRRVVRGCLGYRRKTLINALKHSGLVLPEDAEGRMEEAGIDSHRRPETLPIEEFVRLSQILKL